MMLGCASIVLVLPLSTRHSSIISYLPLFFYVSNLAAVSLLSFLLALQDLVPSECLSALSSCCSRLLLRNLPSSFKSSLPLELHLITSPMQPSRLALWLLPLLLHPL